ncbi:MAG: polyribonucleotide nucleotidyltransferase, partial [Bacilli bacterium]
MSELKSFEYQQGSRKIVVEVGEVGKQANGACVTRFGDTVVLTAAVLGKNKIDADFFPLTILYQEKLYAAGKIPGGFFKREGRPTTKETLTARLIDRPIRPLFEDGFRNEVQVVNTVISSDSDNSSAMSAMMGSSLALCISDIPFEGPISGVVVGRINGEFVINPTVEELEKSDIDLTVAGTNNAINMVEAGAAEVSEDDMLDALMFGFEEIKKLNAFQEKIIAAVGKEKVELEYHKIPEDLDKEVRSKCEKAIKKAVFIKDKLERYSKIDEAKASTTAYFEEKWADLSKEDFDKNKRYLNELYELMVSEEVRRLITEEKIRPDGRAIDEIRPLSSRVDFLPRAHGSALFTRGQT